MLKKFISLSFIILFIGCTKPQINLEINDGENIEFSNSGITLLFDSEMYSTIFYSKDDKLQSLNSNELRGNESLPSFFITTNNDTIKSFKTDFNNVKIEDIENEFGIGKRLTIKGEADEQNNIKIAKKMYVELYNDFPKTAITYAEFINNPDEEIVELKSVFSNFYELDASLVNPKSLPNSFYSFYGTAGRPFPQIETIISKKFETENFIGRPDSLEGIKRGNGGIPIVDLWTKEMGMGIGHIEKKWQNVYFPINTQKNGKVNISIKEIPNMNLDEPFLLKPGENYKTIKTFVNVHSLDFYNTVKNYSELMKRNGINMQTETTENDYLLAWCSWNDYSTKAMASKKDVMMMEQILKRLPNLTDLHIKEIIFDAGWFNNQGDWMPNTNPLTFPNGEVDIIETIDKIHDAGFKVKLWLSYLTADPWSNVAKENPDWMIKKTDGNFHLDRWSGYTMCPSLPEVQQYYKNLAERLVGKYKADGFKVDGMYVSPPCYNPKHNHKNPNESSQDYYKVFEAFYNEAKSTDSKVTILSCPCGTICDYTSLPFVTQTIAADPESYETVRRKSKLYRALKGASTPYSSDYIDIAEGELKFPITLANAIGVGAVPQTFYGKKPGEEDLEIYKKWFKIYSNEMISQAVYLNLYDIHFDKPETYVFIKNGDTKDVYYFSFYDDNSEWNGNIEFRGLDKNKKYSVYDYVNNNELGIIEGKNANMNLSFKKYLLVKCIEE